MESIKCKVLIHQTYLFICAIYRVGLINQAPAINQVPTDDIMTKGI